MRKLVPVLVAGGIGFLGGYLVGGQTDFFEHPENVAPPVADTAEAWADYDRIADDQKAADLKVSLIGLAAGEAVLGLGVIGKVMLEHPEAFAQGHRGGHFPWMPRPRRPL